MYTENTKYKIVFQSKYFYSHLLVDIIIAYSVSCTGNLSRSTPYSGAILINLFVLSSNSGIKAELCKDHGANGLARPVASST